MTAPKLTILTPAYNRVHLLPRLYESIITQETPPGTFEWLVIDDGSTDGTADYLAELAGRHPEWMRFVSTDNGGKHRALNRGAELANGDWAMLVDSDDRLVRGALHATLELISRFHTDECIGSIVSPLRFLGETRVCRFLLSKNPCTQAERLVHEPHLETCTIRRVSAMRNALFPEIADERFIAESWQHFHVSRTYLIWLHNITLVEAEYQPDGLSANALSNRLASAVSATLVYDEMLHHDLPRLARIRARLNQGRFWWHARRRGRKEALSPGPLFKFLSIPFFVSDLVVLRGE